MELTSMFMLFANMQDLGQEKRLMNPLPMITPAAIPGNFSFVIALSASGFAAKTNYSVSISITSPSGIKNNLVKLEKIAIPHQASGGDIGGISITLDVRNYLFTEEGIFKILFEIDDKQFEHQFRVFKGTTV